MLDVGLIATRPKSFWYDQTYSEQQSTPQTSKQKLARARKKQRGRRAAPSTGLKHPVQVSAFARCKPPRTKHDGHISVGCSMLYVA